MGENKVAVLVAFSDFHTDVDAVLGEGDKVALKYPANGTNDGEFQRIAPTGKHASWYVQHVFTLRNGKIVADLAVLDRPGRLEQLGLIPAKAGAEQ